MILKCKLFILGVLSPTLTTNFYITESSPLNALKSYSILWEGSFTIWKAQMELLNVCSQKNTVVFIWECYLHNNDNHYPQVMYVCSAVCRRISSDKILQFDGTVK